VYKDPVWKHKDEEHSVDVVEFDSELTAEDYYLGELEMREPQPPFKITRMSAKRKSQVLRDLAVVFRPEGLVLVGSNHNCH
jgi:hypothetical protein